MNEKDRKEFLKKLAEEGKDPNLIKKLEKLTEKNVNKNRLLKSGGKSGSKKGLSSTKKYGSILRSGFSEDVEVKQINPLKFDGLFLEISEYTNAKREKNPFDGLSPYMKFYEERKSIESADDRGGSSLRAWEPGPRGGGIAADRSGEDGEADAV